jgi:hypothetical protein
LVQCLKGRNAAEKTVEDLSSQKKIEKKIKKGDDKGEGGRCQSQIDQDGMEGEQEADRLLR